MRRFRKLRARLRRQRVRRFGAVAAVAAMTLATAACSADNEEVGPVEAGITVVPVEQLADDFMLGVDVSSVLALEDSGVVFRDADGTEGDLFALIADAGVTDVRVRVWNDPYDAEGRGYGGGTVDADRATEIGRRASAAGMGVYVDFHYSDFWADPAKQHVPKAWEGMSAEEKATAAGEFTRATLQQMKDAGVDVRLVSTGNETVSGVAGETAWPAMTAIFSAGSAAVREVFPDALVAVHFTNPERDGEYARFAAILDNFEVDYDVFASSYYPFWHGTLENLTAVLTDVAQTHGKQVIVAETSWAYTLEDGDGFGNVVGTPELASAYPVSVQGQASAVRDVVQAVADVGEAGIGVFYWEPAWVPVGPPENLEANRELWERDGSGWATSFAGSYDPNDAGQYYGGSGWDNQALFDFAGTALESLRVFEYVRTGAIAPLEVTRVRDVAVRVAPGEPVALPITVTAEYNDGSTEELDVVWDDAPTFDAEGEYIIAGEAEGGHAVEATVVVAPINHLLNPGFEDDDLSMWEFESEAATFQVVADNPAAAVGERAFNFWHDGAYSMRVSQTVTGLAPGTYRVSVSAHGEAAEDARLELVVRTSAGEESAPLALSGWQAWDTATVPEVEVAADGELVLLVEGSLRAGDWGFLDDFVLTPA